MSVGTVTDRSTRHETQLVGVISRSKEATVCRGERLSSKTQKQMVVSKMFGEGGFTCPRPLKESILPSSQIWWKYVRAHQVHRHSSSRTDRPTLWERQEFRGARAHTSSCDVGDVVLSALVVRWSEFLATDPEVSGSIPGTTRFSDKR
jgi:hypothetical protein